MLHTDQVAVKVYSMYQYCSNKPGPLLTTDTCVHLVAVCFWRGWEDVGHVSSIWSCYSDIDAAKDCGVLN